MDIAYHPATRTGSKHTVIFIDTHSRYVFAVELVDLSSEKLQRAFVDFVVHVQKRPKIVVTDRASCFTSTQFTDFMRREGIQLKYCSPNKHQGNAYAERVIGTLKRKALALLNFSRLTSIFYGDAFMHAIMLYNRTIHSSTNIAPLSSLQGKDITLKDLQQFKIFGSTVFYEKGNLGLYIGHDERSTSGTIKIVSAYKTLIPRDILS